MALKVVVVKAAVSFTIDLAIGMMIKSEDKIVSAILEKDVEPSLESPTTE